jgi:hypothetical protein
MDCDAGFSNEVDDDSDAFIDVVLLRRGIDGVNVAFHDSLPWPSTAARIREFYSYKPDAKLRKHPTPQQLRILEAALAGQGAKCPTL